MMNNNKILKKFLVIILIFTLTSTNFIFVTKSLAVSVVEDVFNGISDTGHKNVKFESYFKTETDEKLASVISDVNNENLFIDMDLNVQESGYLKNAIIEITEKNSGEGLNFIIKDLDEEEEYSQIQSIDNNKIYLKQINSGSNVNISLPIEYKNESYVNENILSKDFLVKLEGVYIDDEGEENSIQKEDILNLSWKNEREIKIQTEATKYIDYGSGVIVQTLVKVDNTSENKKSLPIKQSEININVPSFLGVVPSNVAVVANTTAGTNGETPGSVMFDENNWNYNSEKSKLTITVENKKKLVEFNEFEDEFLVDEERIIKEERYYNEPGIDEYLITYTYNNIKMPEQTTVLNTNIEVKTTLFSGENKEENTNIITNSSKFEYKLESQTGSITSLSIDNETPKISKAHIYANYNREDKYENELLSKIIVNISNKEIIENLKVQDFENVYKDKNGNILPNTDIYYKQISILKDDFIKILGENGEIKIFDLNGTQIALINNDVQANEEGYLILDFSQKYDKLNYEISKPISEGNLVILTNKAMKGSSINKDTFANLDSLILKTKIKANYTYVSEEVDVQTVENTIQLTDTVTKATLVLNKENLSTLSLNENVEIRVELNNAVETSDIYGNSTFDIELPNNIEDIEVTNMSVLYGEGLNIEKYEIAGNTIRITLSGNQTAINSGVLTNGTNIVITANLKVNIFTPLKTDKVILTYKNSEATNYFENGYSEAEINYSAPTGLVSVNSIVNYNTENSVITSVRQGKKTDLINVYSEARNAKMEILLMNNNQNSVSNISILGRFPFEGLKDMITGEDLGTTVNTRIINGIVPDVNNNAQFKVYYSVNPEATINIEDPENLWTELPESLENVKSYLIVPQDVAYQMEQSEILKFTYEFEIPANLAHNENIYGTYLVYYTNNSKVDTTNETSCPDIVGITTGDGPELDVKISSNKQEVKEYEQFQVKAIVKNIGKNKAEELNIEIPIPANSVYVSSNTENTNTKINLEGNVLKATTPSIEKNEELEIDVNLKSQEIPSINGVKSEEFAYIEPKTNLEAKDLGTVLSATADKTKIKKAEFEIKEYNTLNVAGIDEMIYKEDDELNFVIQAKNVTTEQLKNIVVTKEIPQEFEVTKSSVSLYQNGNWVEVGKGKFDTESRILTWNLDSLNAKDCAYMNYTVKVKTLNQDLTKTSIGTSAKVKADGTDTYESNVVLTTIANSVLRISQSTDTTDSYINEGENVRYTFSVKNDGESDVNNITFVDKMPDGMSISKISYAVGDLYREDNNPNNAQATVMANLKAKEELTVNIDAVALITDETKEKTVTNYATISADNLDELQTNSITHIIRSVDEANNAESSSNSGTSATNSNSTNNITQTYKISGQIWNDNNRNGMRDDKEEALNKDIKIRLVDSQTGVIKKSVNVDSTGRYSLSGVQNGSYLVIFDYDTVKYGVTTYHKEGVSANANSDAIATKIMEDGKTRNGAITDVITIANESVSGIDMGLVLADAFDLELKSSITKVTIQTSKETVTRDYNNVSLAKEEIAAKNIDGSKVFVEYEIVVTNKGDISGFAKKIVDYLPEGMNFNSSMEGNSDWYTGSDGNLYSTSLAEKELATGESVKLKLVLTKSMTEDNTGIVNNLVEIYEDYNIYGVSDFNSTPGNKAQGENDIGSTDTIILIKTGEELIYVSVIITGLLLGSVVIFVIYKKIVLPRKRGGV